VNATVCQGDTAKFFVVANDTPGGSTINYAWQVSTDGITWSTVKDTLFYSGSATDTLSVIGDATITATEYRAIASNSDGADTLGSAVLTVRQLPVLSAILGATSVCKGSNITLSDTAAGGRWTSTTGSIATVGSTSGIVHGVAQGFDTVKYKVTNACGSTTVTSLIRVDTAVMALPITGPTTTCVGNVITLHDANVLGTGVWSASNTDASVTSTGIVTGLHGGVDVISYVFSNACVSSVTSTVAITVDVLLSHGVISGPKNVCAGSFIHLSETVGGGLWFSDKSSIAVVDPSGNVTGVSGGVDVISYYLSNGCGASVATDTITVDRAVSMITGGDSVGIGGTLALSDSAAGGMWFSNDTSIALIDTFTGLVHGIDTGTTTITYMVTNTCGTTTELMTLVVGPPPFPGQIYGGAGFDSTVCAGSTMPLFDSAMGGVGVWSIVNDTVATIDIATGIVTGVKPGVDTVIYTFTNALGSSMAILPIIVNRPPVITITGPAIVSKGGDYFLGGRPFKTYNPPSAPEYGTWTASNSHMGQILSVIDSSGLGTVSNCSFVVLNPGTDTLTYTIHNECGTSHAQWVMTLGGSGVAVKNVTNLLSDLQVYPNPTDGAFTINLNSANNELVKVSITNVVGAQVEEMTISTNKDYNIKLDQPAGTYILTATTSTGKYSTKVTINK
jgi:hypothetical protein